MQQQQRRHGAGCEGVACEHTLGEQPLHVYGYLWAKPHTLAKSRDGTAGGGGDDGLELVEDSRFRVVLTDTVVFKHQRPVKWLFSSKQEKGRILSKSRKSLSVGQVVHEFLVPKLYTRGTNRDDPSLVLATFAYTERCAATGELQLVVEHLDRAGLLALQNRDKPVLSVLQRFVPTKSGYNHALQAVFTHESCAIRKCVNANLVADASLSVAQRTITFEADEKDLRTRDVTSKELQQSIEQINVEFSAHLERIVGKEIVRHVAYFKVGADDRVYFLWSTLVSFERPGKTFAKHHRLALSSVERHRQSATAQEHAHTNKLLGLCSQLKCCPVCSQMLPRSQVDFLVSYKTVISHAENELSSVRGRDGQTPVPAIMLKICGPMKKKRFEQLKQDSTFLYQTIQLCHPCSLKLNPRQPEICATKSGESREPEASAPPQKPPEAQSAHALFWGRMERRAKVSSGEQTPRARPFSADIPRVRFHRNSSTSTHSSRQYLRHLNQLPPFVQGASSKTRLEDDSQDCLERVTQHLQRKFHRASLRFALAQCNIFPADTVVPASMLCWVCGPELVAAISAYVRARMQALFVRICGCWC